MELSGFQIDTTYNGTRTNRRTRRSNYNITTKSDDEKLYLEGYIENVTYEDVFGKSGRYSARTENLYPVADTNYSGTSDDDSDVWAILVTPKPIKVAKTKGAAKANSWKQKLKTIQHYDKVVRQRRRKIADLAKKASTTKGAVRTKKQIKKINISQTQFGEKRLSLHKYSCTGVTGSCNQT